MTDRLDWNDLINRRPPPTAPTPTPITPVNGHSNGYGRAALTAELDQLLATGEGGRNDQLNRSAFALAQLVASGHLDPTDTRDALRAAAIQVGLTPGETEATLRSAFGAGVQQPRQVPLRPVTDDDPATLLAPAANGAQQLQDGPGEAGAARTSWWPQPIAQRAAQAAEEPTPTHLVRDDGQPLLYSGKVNGLIGESESGKSWVALLAAVQAVDAGQHVLILDFEDSPASIQRRLHALGSTASQLEHLDYANPDEALGLAQSNDLGEALAARYQLIVVDGVNAAMTLLGHDLNSNTDATIFSQKLLRPLAATGACVVTVDHVPKNSDQRGKGGIGAQAKRAMTDGCTLLVDVVEPFGKGQSGTLKLLVDKDRPGHVRGASSGSVLAGRAHLDSTGDQVRLHISAPDLRPIDERGPWRPTAVMEKVSRLLERAEQPMSGNEVHEAVHGRKQVVLQALAELVAGGHVASQKRSGRGGGDAYRSLNPFRDPTSELVPNQFPEPVGEVVPGPVPPTGTGTTSTPPANQSTAEVVPVEKQTAIDLPDGYSHCNRCGQPTDDQTIDNTRGYCRSCGWANR